MTPHAKKTMAYNAMRKRARLLGTLNHRLCWVGNTLVCMGRDTRNYSRVVAQEDTPFYVVDFFNQPRLILRTKHQVPKVEASKLHTVKYHPILKDGDKGFEIKEA